MIPIHLLFKWFPGWARDRVRWWGEVTTFLFVMGCGGIAMGARPLYVMPFNKPSFFYKRKLKKMLRNGKISQATYDKHMQGLAYYQPPEVYYAMGKEK